MEVWSIVVAAGSGRRFGGPKQLVELAGRDEASVSSERLAGLVGVNSATLRRDLAALGITGTRGVGYDVKYLVFEISVILGVNQEWPVAVVGARKFGDGRRAPIYDRSMGMTIMVRARARGTAPERPLR